MARPIELPVYATDATLSSGVEVGMSTRARPSDGLLHQGMLSGHRMPGRWIAWLLGTICDWLGYNDDMLAHRAMQEWRREILPGALSVTYKFIFGVTQVPIKSKVVVALATNLTPKQLYIRAQAGGFEADAALTSDNPASAAASAGDSAWQFAIAPNTLVRYTSLGGASSSVSSGASAFCAVHYAPGSATPFIQAYTNGFTKSASFSIGTAATNPAGLTVMAAATGGTPGGEFADNGGNVVVFSGLCTVGGSSRRRLLTSSDGGASWTVTATLAAASLYMNVVWNATLGLFVAVYEETAGHVGVSTSPDGIIWTNVSNSTFGSGLTTGPLTMASAGKCIAKLSGLGLRYTLDFGATWRLVQLDMVASSRIISAINNRLYVISADGTICTSGLLDATLQDTP